MTTRIALLLMLVAALGGCSATREWAYHQGMSFEKWRAGLNDETVKADDGITWHLLRADPPKGAPWVLLIHGFGADSSNWIRFANELQGQYGFIIPDLPGTGKTTKNTRLDYGIAAQARRLYRLMDKLGIRRFHVAGNSMGGAIAIEMARLHPDRILSLGLVDSAGITLEKPAFLNAIAQQPSNPLIPHSAKQFHNTLDWATNEGVGIPGFMITQMGKEKAANAKVAEKVWADINKDPAMRLKGRDILPRIKTPTLILWGAKDRILGLDNVKVFQKEMPDTHTVILKNAGRLPMAEEPGNSADAFRKFWKNRDSDHDNR